MRKPSLFAALVLCSCMRVASHDPVTGLRLSPEVEARVAKLPHAQGLLADLDDAVQNARLQVGAAGTRVLFVSPVSRSCRLASTGGQRNVAFLSAGAARLGMQVASYMPEGQTADFLAAQNVTIYRRGDAAYVRSAEVAALREQVVRFARAFADWRNRPGDEDARAGALEAFEAAAALLSPTAHDDTAQEAARAYPHDDPLRASLLQLVQARQLRVALAAHRAEVCVADLSGDALASVLAAHGTDVQVSWYVQNAGSSPDDALIAQDASLVACSPSALEAKCAQRAFAQRSYVVPNGIALARYARSAAHRVRARQTMQLPEDTFVVGQVGYVSELKDQATTLRAFATLQRQVPHAYLVLVGSTNNNGYTNKLCAAIRTAGLGNQVRLLGDVDDVAAVLPALDVVVSASHDEGYGLAVAEAMAAARAVVLTNIPPHLHLGGDAALYFAPGDDAALARQLGVLVDRAVRDRWSERAQDRAFAAGADHAEMLASFVSVLVELAQRSRGA